MPNRKVAKVPQVSKAKTSTMSLRSSASPEKQSQNKDRHGQKTDLAMTKKISQTITQKSSGLTVKVYDLKGKEAGTITLPKEIFGQKPNKNLLAQAIRVYAANIIPKTSNTKTRGEVRGGGIKPWRQKGTGRARAGSRRSPLWVGGGITFGPRTRDVKLQLPQKMKHKALIYALSAKAQQGQIKVLANIEKAEPKTKPMALLFNSLSDQKKNLLVVAEKSQNLKLATRNIPDLSLETPNNLNAYQVLKINELFISKESIEKFK